MKISKVEIYNYKSIGDKCEIDFDEKSTTLVGRSNVGKTNILEAISFAFTVDPLDEEHICSWNRKEPLCVRIYLRVEDKDIPSLREINPSFARLKYIIMDKFANGKMEYSSEPVLPAKKIQEPTDEVIRMLSRFRARIRSALREMSPIMNQLSAEEQLKAATSQLNVFVNEEKKLNPAKDKNEQVSILNNLLILLRSIRTGFYSPNYRKFNTRGIKVRLSFLIKDITDFVPSVEYNERIVGPITADNMEDLLPYVYYLSTGEELDETDEIYVDEFDEADDYNFMKCLINLSGFDLNVLRKGKDREIADPEREANKNIAEKLSRYWNQEALRIELRVEKDAKNSRRKIELDFIGSEGWRSRILDQSPGTRWFIAFVIEYLVDESDLDDRIDASCTFRTVSYGVRQNDR